MKTVSTTYVTLLFFLSGIMAFAQPQPDTARAELLYRTAQDQLGSGAYDSAYLNFHEAMTIYEESEFRERYSELIYYVGLALHYDRKDEEALEWYEKSMVIMEESKPAVDPFIADILNNVGSCYINMGYRFKARSYLEDALNMNIELYGVDSVETAVSQYNYGLVTMYFGEYQTSLKSFMAAHPAYLRRYGENGSRVAQLYTNVGILHQHIGDYELAMDYFTRAINIHLENHGPDYWNLAFPYSTMGGAYSDLGEKDKSMEYYNKALKLCEETPDKLTRLKSNIHGSLGRIYRREGEYEKSEAQFNQAIDIMIKRYHDQHARLADFYRGLGDLYMEQDKFEAAKDWYAKAISIMENNYGKVHPKLTTTYYKQARMYRDRKDYDRSLTLIQEGYKSLSPDFTSDDPEEMPSIEEVLDIKQLLFLSLLKGTVYHKRGEENSNPEDLKSALTQYDITTDIIDHIRRGYLSENSKLFLQENSVSIYENAIETCAMLYELEKDPQHLERALYFIEKSKSTVLSEALQVADLRNVQGIPPEILSKEEELNGYVRSLELKLANAGIGENDSVQNALKKELFMAKISVDSLVRVIEQDFPNYHNLKYNMEVVSASTIQKELDANTAVLSFFEGDSTWYIHSMNQGSMSLKQVSKSQVSNEIIEQFRVKVSDPGSVYSDFGGPGLQIYEHLVKNGISDFENITRLIIVPAGQLGYIPFDALVSSPVNEEESPDYLINTYTISYVNSLTLLAQNQERKSDHGQNYVGFAPDYPETFVAAYYPSNNENLYRDELTRLIGTKEEVSYAGKIFKGSTYLDEEATEENFKNLLNSPTILHLAMHALLNDKDPMRSQLIFTYGADTVKTDV